MFEIRYSRGYSESGGDPGDLFRHYECEPRTNLALVAGLHMHRKTVDSLTNAAINALQDQEIDYAAQIARQRESGGWATPIKKKIDTSSENR
jgi:hypothetical protein